MRQAALLLLLVSGVLRAQTLPPATYPFRTYGAEAGLGNLSATSLAQDAAGFLWVGTQDGVYRYDGTRFTRFGLDEGLPSTFVGTLRAGRGGGLWASTAAGVARWDGRRFVVDDRLPRVAPNAISVDASNRLWAAMPQGLYVDGIRVAAFGKEPTAVWCDPVTRDVWVGSTGGVTRLGAEPRPGPSRGHVPPGETPDGWRAGRPLAETWSLPAERIDSVVVDAEGRVWARSAAHLWSLAPGGAEFVDESAALPGTSNTGYLALDARRNLWVPTDRGLAVYEGARASRPPAAARLVPPGETPDGRRAGRPRADGWRIIGAREGLPTEWARDVLEDREGSLWVASLGVHRMLGRGELVSYKRGGGLPNEVTWCFLRDRDGRLLVGTDLGLARSSSDGWSVVDGTERMQIRTVAADGAAIWAGGNNPPEVVRLEEGKVRRFDVGARAILSLLRDRSGTIWAGTRGAGLLRKAPNEPAFTRVHLPHDDPTEDVRHVVEDAGGRVWASGVRGLICLENGTWRRFTTRDGLARDYVSFLRPTAAGDLWVAYFEPLGIVRVRLDGHGFRVLQRVDIPKKVFLLGEDGRQRLWIGTGAGIDILGDGATMEHLGAADGLAGDDTDANAFYADPQGNVFIGTSSGFTRYVPRADPPRLAPPPLWVSAATGGRRGRDLSGEFSALSFFKPDIIEYEYRLLGLDDVWQRATETRARWTQLPAGRYRFEVRARLRPGPFGEPVGVGFTIEPAWWQTWWARGLGLVMIIGLIFAAHRTRVALLRRRNRELEALVEQRTGELAAANEQLRNLSVTDALTGMKNRRYLESDPTAGSGEMVFLLIDVDRFKEINDRLGHAAGDEVLIGLHELLGALMRDSDTLVRWGGEELLFIARNASRADAPNIAERIRAAVEQHEFPHAIRITCSVGFAAWPFAEGASWQDVIDVADVCLYAAKAAGRNCWVGVTPIASAPNLVARLRESLAAVVASGEVVKNVGPALSRPNHQRWAG
jgi:diguanylate cyclase (GGDEF)-like protein